MVRQSRPDFYDLVEFEMISWLKEVGRGRVIGDNELFAIAARLPSRGQCFIRIAIVESIVISTEYLSRSIR